MINLDSNIKKIEDKINELETLRTEMATSKYDLEVAQRKTQNEEFALKELLIEVFDNSELADKIPDSSISDKTIVELLNRDIAEITIQIAHLKSQKEIYSLNEKITSDELLKSKIPIFDKNSGTLIYRGKTYSIGITGKAKYGDSKPFNDKNILLQCLINENNCKLVSKIDIEDFFAEILGDELPYKSRKIDRTVSELKKEISPFFIKKTNKKEGVYFSIDTEDN